MYEDIRNKIMDDKAALALLQEVAKDKRMDQMREERELKNNQPATARQIKFLKKLGIEMFDPGLTKKQASTLIDETMAKSNGSYEVIGS
jgi:hypothetical protein